MEYKNKYKRELRKLVLIVDDEAINREMLGFIVGNKYDVLYAENGQQALDILRDKKELISLVLLDIMMPVMTGYELLGVMSEDKDLSKIPVIVLTSEKNAEVKSLQLGASDFIPKPYNQPEVIMARIDRTIELYEDAHIIQAAERDALTRLYNIEFFYEYVHELDVHHPDWDMDALVININHFRLINELYGRAYGDKVLSVVADAIRDLLEEVDGIAARAGADNFYLYLRHREDFEESLHSIGGRIRKELDKSSVWLRMGVYSHTNESAEIEKRFEKALSACNTLRNRFNKYVAYYDKTLHEQELLEEFLVNSMEHGIENGEFKVYYQAKYAVQEDPPRLCSAEALVRWIHPEKGFLSPGIFIPLFEKNGLIQKLDRFIFREVARQIGEWKEKLGVYVPISVNVSRLDIYEKDHCDFLVSLLKEYGISASDMFMEITESAYTEDSEQLVTTVEQMRDSGFKIEMDDFGSGYSSLNMLTILPIDYLKLDMKFLQNADDEEKRHGMLQLMIDIADHLEVPVVAEGVETEDQFRMLRDLGCDTVQGYYFAKPVPAKEFEERIVKELKC